MLVLSSEEQNGVLELRNWVEVGTWDECAGRGRWPICNRAAYLAFCTGSSNETMEGAPLEQMQRISWDAYQSEPDLEDMKKSKSERWTSVWRRCNRPWSHSDAFLPSREHGVSYIQLMSRAVFVGSEGTLMRIGRDISCWLGRYQRTTAKESIVKSLINNRL